MALASGTKLGPYEILAPLGAGAPFKVRAGFRKVTRKFGLGA